MSNMRSASSSTRKEQRCMFVVPFSRKSNRRPGVATTTSTPKNVSVKVNLCPKSLKAKPTSLKIPGLRALGGASEAAGEREVHRLAIVLGHLLHLLGQLTGGQK